MVQVPVTPLYLDNRYAILMRHASYACSLKSGNKGKAFRYVAFAEGSCEVNMTVAREIVFPKNVTKKVAVCTKVAYGDLDPDRLVEWIEFYRLVGVDVVQVFYHIVSERTLNVFKYYQKSGFVILSSVNPAVMKGHPPRGYLRPRWEEQAWTDGTVPCNDCLHRLYLYDFVVILDFDELLVPLPPYNTLLQVAQDAAKQYPNSASFFIESFIVLLDLPPSNNQSAIFFLQRLIHSASNKLDSLGRGKSSPKLFFRPRRVAVVSTHDLTPMPNYSRAHLPLKSHKFLHYRMCKSIWKECIMNQTKDTDILKFEPEWVKALLKLPLRDVGCTAQYVARLKRREAKMNNSD